MFTTIFENLIKPFTGLVLIIKLFAGVDSEDRAPSIKALQLATRSDSVFIQVSLRNSMTQEIKDLVVHGTKITTISLFRCDSISKIWNRTLQYNPIKEYVCFVSVNDECTGKCTLYELDEYFNELSLYIGTRKEIQMIQKRKAELTIKVTTDVDAYSLGKTDLWPKPIAEEFVIPKLP